jgi:Uma2 family endonuclease
MQEIELADNVKPALEWVNNRILQKVSPQRAHALAQGRFFSALDSWASNVGSGMVGTEWRFQIKPPNEIRRSLVPDVAYLSYARLPRAELETTDAPRVTPDAVVEILSPEDKKKDVSEKVRVYLAAGTNVVFLVDTERKRVIARDASGIRFFDENGIIEHETLAGFRMPARRLFELPKPKES